MQQAAANPSSSPAKAGFIQANLSCFAALGTGTTCHVINAFALPPMPRSVRSPKICSRLPDRQWRRGERCGRAGEGERLHGFVFPNGMHSATGICSFGSILLTPSMIQ